MNDAVVIFVIFSFLGWVWESVYCSICKRKWANRGFLYGPVCPIYGFGCVLGFFTYNAAVSGVLPDLTFWQVFIVGFVVSMILEYPTSWLLEKLFNARWWDYSNVPMNINGRTSVPTSVAFGAAAIAIMKWVMPFTLSVLSGIPQWVINLAALIFVAVLSADLTLTVSALTDFQRQVAELDNAFQNHMTETVYQIINSKNHFSRNAINRVQKFRHPIRANGEARKLRKEKFSELMKKYMETPEYAQHRNTTAPEHYENVAWISFLINERLHLNADEKELVEAAMLHDFNLNGLPDEEEGKTTCEAGNGSAGKNAGENAEGTKMSVRSHMWPGKIGKIPKSKETAILRFADKYCALVEMLRVGK